MDSLPINICTEILEDIMGDTEKTIENCAAVHNKNFADFNSEDAAEEEMIELEQNSNLDGNAESEETGYALFVDDILEELIEKAVSADETFGSDNIVEIVCTEIFDDLEKNETANANDLNWSWYDLFKEAYGGWGREETVEDASEN